MGATRTGDIVLTMSELVSNSLVKHDRKDSIHVELDGRHTRVIRLTVIEDSLSASLPQLVNTDMPHASEGHGRGIPLISRLAARLSFETANGRTTSTADFTY